MKETVKERVERTAGCITLIIIMAVLAGLLVYWTHQNDKLVEQIAKDEAVASFPAQVVVTTNGKRVFIWEKNGKVEGYVVEEEY